MSQYESDIFRGWSLSVAAANQRPGIVSTTPVIDSFRGKRGGPLKIKGGVSKYGNLRIV